MNNVAYTQYGDVFNKWIAQLADWLTDWLADWLIDWLTNWLTVKLVLWGVASSDSFSITHMAYTQLALFLALSISVRVAQLTDWMTDWLLVKLLQQKRKGRG